MVLRPYRSWLVRFSLVSLPVNYIPGVTWPISPICPTR